ncbi:hypothetical protein EHO57_13905 [Leptospira langatensis]|uniref:Uncharacterized protein n=1 Tax=Leptospira langatensis TaxID=2484983 RepID=A0A5R2ATF8_9LEPT|nr:hypothetical protein [Leptospira langatensis]TGJ99850.1 hypothetical protein EHO57_13905 [Leptospira langatensis]
MNYEGLYEKGKFPRTKRVLSYIANAAKEAWSSNVLAAKPAWWGRMAMSSRSGGGGGIKIIPIPGGFRIYHPNTGKYPYMKVLEKGRARYDIKAALLAGPRARMGEHGRYTIIPLSKNDNGSEVSPSNNQINSVMTKVRSYKEPNADGKIVSRNQYSYRTDPGMTGKGNVFATEQVYKNGHVQRSFMKFVTISERTRGWYYPAIPAQKILVGVKKDVEKALRSDSVKKAVAGDMKDLIRELIRQKK